MMIAPPAASLLAQPFPEDASQPHPDPLVQAAERVIMAVFEVFKPATQARAYASLSSVISGT